jgi:5-deoxy-glucuronate isomerase
MADWVYPLGSAAEGCWDVSLGTADSRLRVDGWAHTGLKVATLAPGAAVELPAAGEERIVIPLSGAFTVTVDGEKYQLAGRAGVFSGPADVLYSGTGKAVTVSSSDGGRVAGATAPPHVQ